MLPFNLSEIKYNLFVYCFAVDNCATAERNFFAGRKGCRWVVGGWKAGGANGRWVGGSVGACGMCLISATFSGGRPLSWIASQVATGRRDDAHI